MHIRVDANLGQQDILTLESDLGSSIKGDMSLTQFSDIKQLNRIDFKRELISVVVSSDSPENIKYLKNFMKNEQRQQSFYVLFKSHTPEAQQKLKNVENPRLKMVSSEWGQIREAIQDIYQEYYRKLVEFKGESKVKNKYYDIQDKDVVLNVYYP